ncbi:MAG: response regulator [Planctomycetales bacterium]|nr:response regulator [Planctomycetales bacterium]
MSIVVPEALGQAEVPAAKKKVYRHRILCIDDDPCIVSTLTRSFRGHGIEVIPAYHGMQGYWTACTEAPQLVIVDLCMPRGNGEYVIGCLKRNSLTRDIPLVVLSGAQDRRLRKRVREMGVDAFLLKPAPFSAVHEAVEGLL